MHDPPRVLLIDDSEVSRLVCETLVVAEGYDMRTVDSLAALRVAVQEWPPDVILTDLQMPGVSGEQVCQELKSNPDTRAIPVVLYSSLPEEQLVEVALRCGADGVVSKARRHEDLPVRLREICSRS